MLAPSLLPLALAAAAAPKPHIMFVLIDDWGHYNVGFRDPTVHSPNLDAIARDGAILDRHYVYKVCSPSRSALMTGRLPMHVKQDNDVLSGIPIAMKTVADGLKSAGYKTYQLGKWHLGSATWRHIPQARGFDGSLGYFSGAQDAWNQHPVNAETPYVDLWDTDKPAYGMNGTTYTTFLLDARVKQVISQHDPAVPLFVYYAFKNSHSPLEAPQQYLDMYSDQCPAGVGDNDCKIVLKSCYVHCLRQRYLAQVSVVDEAVGNLTDALKGRGMWDNTLVVVSADNGGPIYNVAGAKDPAAVAIRAALGPAAQGGATNYPLRGGKVTNFEGGVRASAFIGGGFFPASRKGAVVPQLMHICDWYATFLGLAGAALPPTEEGMPPLDSVDQWPVIAGATSTPARTEVPLDRLKKGGVDFIQQQGDKLYKLLIGVEHQDVHSGPNYPNASSPAFSPAAGPKADCGDGCLYDVAADPEERHDLAKELPDVLAAMQKRSEELDATYWQHDAQWEGPANEKKAHAQAVANGGFNGPFEA